MKKLTIIVSLLGVIMFAQRANAAVESEMDHCQRVVLTLLAPDIQEQIETYYEDKLTVSPIFAPFLESSELVYKYYSSHMEVQVTVTPYVGPHLDVGKDIITFQLNNDGSRSIIKYKHVEDFKLPPHYSDIVK